MLSLNFTPFPVLTTKRLLLRQMTLADAPAVQRLRSNTDVMKYINRPLTLTVAEAEAWIGVVISTLEKTEGITWCICLKESPAEHVGSIGLWRIEKENYRAEIGYMLEPSLQGKGIMFEALQKVVEYGFEEMKLHSIEGQIDPRNAASAALLKKAGFEQEAYFKENYYLRGGFADTAVFSILTPRRQTSHTAGTLQEAGLIS
jgi:[ribosomal protein S5]-alanine N-acetyltransferase